MGSNPTPSSSVTSIPPSAASPRDRPDHADQLDGLRAVAVLGVLLSHFWRALPVAHAAGYYGVRLFFVLSGFLITGILLDCRALVEGGQSAATTVRRFYVRRFLRIAPAYYGLLLVTWLLRVDDVRATIKWDLLYLTNVYLVRADRWLGTVSHLWSLAVEEQFYLAWPAVVLFTPRRRLGPVVLGVVAAGVVFRAAWLASDLPTMAVWTLPFGSLDSLGIGSLLALNGVRAGAARPEGGAPPAARWVGWLGWPALTLLLVDQFVGGRAGTLHLVDTAFAVVAAYLVLRAATGGFRGLLGRALELPPLLYLGRISYGVYLVHLFVPLGYDYALRRLGTPGTADPAIWAAWQTAITVALAALSWHLYERPINALKRYFPYRARAVA